jgi:hypothetical protein
MPRTTLLNLISGTVIQTAGMHGVAQRPDTDTRGHASVEMCYVVYNPYIEIDNP